MNYLDDIPIFDGHNDTLKKIFLSKSNFYDSRGQTELDVSRAMKTGLKCGLFAVLAIAEKKEERESSYGLKVLDHGWQVEYPRILRQEYAQKFSDEVIDYFLKEISKISNVQIVKTYHDLQDCIFKDCLSIILHFEGAEAIKCDLSNLETYYEKGLRSLGLVWSRANYFGYGVPFRFPSGTDIGEGLTVAGRELVRKCNNMGILIDLAHINEKGFFDTAKLTKAPLVVSHTGVHCICSSSTNLTDEQMHAVKDSNGVIGIIFDILNTRSDGKLVRNTSLNVILEHIEYVIYKIGIDHVVFGSDFDGAIIPDEIKDITGMRKIIYCLKQLGYNYSDIEKVCYKNWLRVIGDTWK